MSICIYTFKRISIFRMYKVVLRVLRGRPIDY